MVSSSRVDGPMNIHWTIDPFSGPLNPECGATTQSPNTGQLTPVTECNAMSVKNEAVYYRILRNLNEVVKFGKASMLALIVLRKCNVIQRNVFVSVTMPLKND
jgi:hypothetical protein